MYRPHGSVSTTPASRSTFMWLERFVCLAPVSSTRWVVQSVSRASRVTIGA